MANSSFQKNQNVPFSVSEGGTGVSSLTIGGVLIGAGTGDVSTISPGTSGNVLKSNGTDWTSGTNSSTPADGSITYAKIATDLTQIVDLSSATNVDWSLGGIYTKTLTANTTLTFSNYKLNKSIILKIAGNYTLVFPKSVKKIVGTYDGSVTNYIHLHCTKDTAVQEVWASINQGTSINYYGYFAGGATGSAIPVSTTDRIVFSTGVTSANTVSNLSLVRYSFAGLSDAVNYGYFAGGDTSSDTYTTNANRIVFSTGVNSANTVSNLSQAKAVLAGLSDASSYGYFSGGYTTTVVNTTDRIVFSTGVTSANTVSNLSQARYGLTGISDSLTYGYFAGGATPSFIYVATADRIVFSTGVTSANTVSNLSQARIWLTGISDSSTYGYFSGGTTEVNVTTTDRIVFSTSVTSANTVSNLSQAVTTLAGLSDASNYGYFSGGYTGSTASIVATDRIIFSTGATSANTVSNLSQARFGLAGLSDCSV